MSEARTFYLMHFMSFDRAVLEYDLTTGEFRRAELPADADCARGFFTAIDDELYGVHASLDGPVFFWKENTVNLLREDVAIEVRDLDRHRWRRAFNLSVNDQPILRVEYKPLALLPTMGSLSDEDVDFFYWLHIQVRDPEFRSRYTAPPDTPSVSPEVQAILERLEKERKRDRPSQE